MLIKNRDTREQDIATLHGILSSYTLEPKQRFLIEREIRSIRKGEQGEKFKSTIQRPEPKRFDSSSIISADCLETTIMRSVDKESKNPFFLLNAGKFTSLENVTTLANKLAQLHTPKTIDYLATFGIRPDQKITTSQDSKPERRPGYFCAKCKKGISERKPSSAGTISNGSGAGRIVLCVRRGFD